MRYMYSCCREMNVEDNDKKIIFIIFPNFQQGLHQLQSNEIQQTKILSNCPSYFLLSCLATLIIGPYLSLYSRKKSYIPSCLMSGSIIQFKNQGIGIIGKLLSIVLCYCTGSACYNGCRITHVANTHCHRLSHTTVLQDQIQYTSVYHLENTVKITTVQKISTNHSTSTIIGICHIGQWC